MKTPKLVRSPLFLLIIAAFVFCGIGTVSGDDAPAPKPRCAVAAGQQAPAFQAKTVDGKTVNFPGDYKGKIVMLDFWATWCGPCRAELPNVSAAYDKYHKDGFEIVSVSLDQPRQGPAVVQFTRDHNMTWPQIYDGGYWKAAVAAQYEVHAIPCPVIIDGDTGKVLASGASAVGSHMNKVLASAMAAKMKLGK